MGIFAKIKKAWFDTIVWETIDDEFYDELEDSLIMADLGATVAHDAVKKLRDVVYQKSIQRGDDVKQALRDILIEKLNVGDTALDLSTQAERRAGHRRERRGQDHVHRQDRPPSEGRGQARAFMRGRYVPRGGGGSA